MKNASLLVATLLCVSISRGTYANNSTCLPDTIEASAPVRTALGGTTVARARRPLDSLDLLKLNELGGMAGSGLSVSPDQRWLAFEIHRADLDANSYCVAWYVATASAPSVARHVGDGGDPILFRLMNEDGSVNGAWLSERPKWSPDSRWIYYRRRVHDEVQIWRSSVATGAQELVTQNRADVERFEWSSDGTKLYFEVDVPREQRSDAAESERRSGYRFDMSRRWSTSHKRPLYRRYSLRGEKAQIWVYELGSGAERLATQREAAEYADLIGPPQMQWSALGRDVRAGVRAPLGRSVAWLSPTSAQMGSWDPPLTLYWSPTGSEADAVPCEAFECQGRLEATDWSPTLNGTLSWSNDGKEIYFVRKEGANYGHTVLLAWQPGARTARRIFETDDWLSDCNKIGKRAVCFLESATYPRTVVDIDLENGRIERVIDPNPQFANFILGETKKIEWQDKAGRATFGILVKPLGYQKGKRYPLIIAGYRARYALRGAVGEEYPVHVFAAHGFVVLVYDMPEMWEERARATDGKDITVRTDKNFVELAVGLQGIEAVIDRLSQEGIVDSERVAITGLSTGASQVSYALVNSDRFAAAAVSSVPHNPTSYYLTGAGEEWRETLRELGLGPLGQYDGRAWKKISLALNVDRVRVPLLVNTSDDEFPQAMEAVVALDEASRPVEVYVYPNEYHVKWFPQHRYHIYERNVDWFNFWLRGDLDNDSSKMTQYQRWEKLRAFIESENREQLVSK